MATAKAKPKTKASAPASVSTPGVNPKTATTQCIVVNGKRVVTTV